MFVNIKSKKKLYIQNKEYVHRFPYLYKSTACFYKDKVQVIHLTTGKIKICKMYITARVQIIRHRGTAVLLCVRIGSSSEVYGSSFRKLNI